MTFFVLRRIIPINRTPTERITFTSGQASPAPGDWGAILFTETAVGARFDGAGNYAGVHFEVTNGTYTDSEEITITVVDVP